jgi:predicted esterase
MQIHLLSILFTILFIAIGIISSGCQKIDQEFQNLPDNEKFLVSSELIGEYKVEAINRRFNYISMLFTNHDIKVYRIVYRTTDQEGNAIKASGAVLLPRAIGEFPLLSLHHGTITNDQSAPSYNNYGSEVYNAGTLMASNGYIISAPDYIGYGASRDKEHPYEHAETLGSASLDMLRATKEFCFQEGVRVNDQLFLTGYSEGGYATMALHKRIEQQASKEFAVTASAPGAGAYDKTAFANYILEKNKELPYMNNYLWVLDTYNKTYNLDHDWSYYLNDPYANNVQTQGIFTSISGNPAKLFAQSFKDGVLNNSNRPFLNALKDNDIYNWAPQAPVNLYHGTADDFVPPFNSINAYNAMKAKGAKNVKYVPLEGKNHGSAIMDFSINVISWFSTFKQPA